ncbi:MAG TPA: hypothetical protein VNC41_03465, partial [Acidimicrobiia bacterium]|nr:hypothetical protein [Acidimicrobiia bacterium]
TLSKGGKVPQAAAVVAHFEKQQRARLSRLGVDPDALIGAKKTAPVAKVNGTKAAANANASESAKVPTRDELIAELSSLDS